MRTLTIPLSLLCALLLLLGMVALSLPAASAQEEPTEEAEVVAETVETEPAEALEPLAALAAPVEPEALEPLTALAAPAPQGQFFDGYWEQNPVVPNPPMPQRCGLNIALVFDLSNSIGDTGLAQSKAAGNAFIEGLKNTPTTLGVYNFATLAPTQNVTDKPQLDLSTDAGVSAARQAMTDLRLPTRVGDDRGGTNWEGALKNVAASGVSYDVVYFITDGVPTTNNALYPGTDYGAITHNIDITRAITAANTLKAGGTRLEVIAVKMPIVGVSVLQDNVQEGYNSHGALLPFSESTTWGWDSTNQVYFYDYSGNLTYVFVPQAYWYLFSDAVRDGALTYDETTSGTGRYYYLTGADATAAPAHRWAFYWGSEEYKFRMYQHRLAKPSALSVATSLTGNAADILALRSYDELAAQLREAAVAICGGTVIVEKQLVDAHGTLLSPGANWQFTADDVRSTDPAHPIYLVDENAIRVATASGTTDAEGRAQFAVKTDTPHRSGSVRITETQAEKHLLRQQGGKNAVCHDKNDRPVPVSNDGDLGFRVDIATDQTISCVVQNMKDDYRFSVSKSAQPTTPVAFDGTLTARYEITVRNEGDAEARLRDPVLDRVTYPAGFQVTGVEFLLDGRVIDGVTRTPEGYVLPATALGSFPARGAKKIEVRVQGTAGDTAVRDILAGAHERCETPATATPRSLHNSVSLVGDEDETDNHACTDPEQPGMRIDKSLDGEIGRAEDGTRTVTYLVTVDNTGGIDRTYDLSDTPGFAESVRIEYATITGQGTDRVEGAGPYRLAEKREIAAGATHTYRVTVHFRGPTGDITRNQECSTEGAGHGLFNRVELTSGVLSEDDDACAPVPAPEKVSLRLVKVGADDLTTPLAGAAFAVHAVHPDGTLGAHVTDLRAGGDGFHSGTLDADREYFLVETRSPQAYQLLTTPVKVKVALSAAGPRLEILNAADAVSATVGDADGDTVVLQVADIRIGSLPKTGGPGVGTFALLAGVLLGAGVWLTRRVLSTGSLTGKGVSVDNG
ncbi:SpaA isopeptide-forming pilin-related protein [Corynebacterium nasicanis]|uniref:SpaA isopeptide-forming pilin-related protein n=1 Tax=Corynebacterium nasicanis TaxID=1448267 RepID=A0ABW1QC18_9CORY